MLIADTLKLDQAFALVSPRRVAQVLREDRHTAYAARKAIREAAAKQDATWQAEFWQQVRRYDIPLAD
jgi:hypothetical protein